MEKKLSLFIMLAFSFLPNVLRAQEAYAVVKDKTITFYYDNNKGSREGVIYDIAAEYAGKGDYPAWQSADIVKAVFNPSFVNYEPISTAQWFRSCSNIRDIENFHYLNTTSVTSMESMFYECSSLEKIDFSSFKTSNVTSMYCMFYGCNKLEYLDLSSFDTRNVANMVAMFYDCTSLKEIKLSSFDTMNVEDMQYLFFSCSQLKTLDLTSFNTEKVTNMEAMFAYCSHILYLDLSSFKTSNVTNMDRMFTDCTNLRTIYASEGWSTERVTSGSFMFWDVENIVGGEGTEYNILYGMDHQYARIDRKSNDSPGYFTYKIPIGINSILTNKNVNKNYYTIEGMKVDRQIHKGIIISNNKKILIK